MTLRRRLGRLEVSVGPPPTPLPPPSPEDLEQRLQEGVGEQTYNRGVFDDDPEFRPAWSHYHRLWEVHTGGYSPLQAVWLVREPEEFEAARRAVVAVMVRVLAGQPYPQRALGVLLGQSLREHPRPQDEEGTP
jgi:hypothetical protein